MTLACVPAPTHPPPPAPPLAAAPPPAIPPRSAVVRARPGTLLHHPAAPPHAGNLLLNCPAPWCPSRRWQPPDPCASTPAWSAAPQSSCPRSAVVRRDGQPGMTTRVLEEMQELVHTDMVGAGAVEDLNDSVWLCSRAAQQGGAAGRRAAARAGCWHSIRCGCHASSRPPCPTAPLHPGGTRGGGPCCTVNKLLPHHQHVEELAAALAQLFALLK